MHGHHCSSDWFNQSFNKSTFIYKVNNIGNNPRGNLGNPPAMCTGQWPRKPPQWEETWSRPGLWRVAFCFDLLRWKWNAREEEIEVESEWRPDRVSCSENIKVGSTCFYSSLLHLVSVSKSTNKLSKPGLCELSDWWGHNGFQNLTGGGPSSSRCMGCLVSHPTGGKNLLWDI